MIISVKIKDTEISKEVNTEPETLIRDPLMAAAGKLGYDSTLLGIKQVETKEGKVIQIFNTVEEANSTELIVTLYV